jgi:phosphoglycerol transferase
MEYRTYRAPLSVPLYDSGDALFTGFLVKTVADSGWWTHNEYTGGSTKTSMYDYPNSDGAFYVLVKIVTFFTHDYGLVTNIIFFLGFLLSGVSSFYVSRRTGMNLVVAIATSLLYAFLPYHLFRGESHLFLSEYFVLPFVTMVLLDLLGSRDKENARFLIARVKLSKATILPAVIMFITGSSGIYYAFFTCCFLLFVLVLLFAENKRLSILPLLYMGIVCLMLLVNFLPSFINAHIFGPNSYVGTRSQTESEIYGLRIDLMIFPVYKNIFSPFSYFAGRMSSFLINENVFAYLGIWGVLGLVLLFSNILLKSGTILLNSLSRLNLFAVLLGTIGGGGAIFALVITPSLRAWNRISIFIAYFALLALGLYMSKIIGKIRRESSKYLVYAVIAICAIGGLLDQYVASRAIIPDRRLVSKEYQSDEDFLRTVEANSKGGDMVFQLPYMAFPENGPINKMGDYDQFKGYLHSHKLRWSYGVMKGRAGDQWISSVSTLDAQGMVDEIGSHGYKGIYIDRFGYTDSAASLEGQLNLILGGWSMESPDHRLVYYSISNYVSQNGLDKIPKDMKDCVGAFWTNGFSNRETSKEASWIWSDKAGELIVENDSKETLSMKFSTSFATGYNEFSNLYLSGIIQENMRINSTPKPYTKVLTIKPGRNVVHFSTDAKRVAAPNDARSLYFRVFNPILL